MAKPTPPSSLSPEEQEAWLKKAQSLSLEQQAAFLKAKEKPLGKADASSDINESAPIAWESGLSGNIGAAPQTLPAQGTGMGRPTDTTAHSADMVPQASTRGRSAASAGAHATGVQAAPSPDPTGTRMGVSSAAAGGAGVHDPLVGTATHAAAGAPALHAAHVANAGNAGTGLAGSVAANTGSSSAGVAPNPPLKVSGDLTGSVIEDGALVATGKLTVAGGAPGARQWALGSHMGQYGTLDIDQSGQWHYHLANNNSTVQALGAGHTATEHFIAFVTDADGQTRPVQLAIKLTGTNDAAIVAGVDAGAVTEDHALQATGTLTIHDVDTGEAHFQATDITGQFGALHLDAAGKWTYDLDNAAAQKLGAGNTASEVLTVRAADGTAHQITITVTGTNDAPVLTAQSQLLNEGDAVFSAQLTVTDADSGDTQAFSLGTPVAGLTLDPDGHYHFNPADPAYDHLKAGEQLILDIPVTVTDSQGAQDTQHLHITLTGTNDAPTLQVAPVSVREDAGVVRDRLIGTDVDTGDILVYGARQVVPGFTLHADGSYSFDPANAAYQHLANGEQQLISIPVTVTDQAGAHSEQMLQITVTGTNDAPVLLITPPQAVFEGAPPIHGRLAAIDVDVHDTLTYRATAPVAGFTIQPDGHYSFDPADPSYDHLAFGQQQIINIPVEVTDSSGGVASRTVQITVTGTNDAPTLTVMPPRNVNEGTTAIGGHLTATDPDSGDTLTFSLGQHVAGLTLQADGTYTFDPADPAYNYLPAGQKAIVSVPVLVTDQHGGSDTQHLQITVTGTNDGAIVGGIDHAMGSVAAAQGGRVHIDGQLIAIDLDQGEAHFQSQLITGTYGTLEIHADGHWSYVADTTQAALANLPANGHLPEHFTVRTADGTTHDIDLQIKGANAPAIFAGVSAGMVHEDQPGSISHHLSVTDPNAGESAFQPQDQGTTYGHFTINAAGDWTYAVDNANPAVQALTQGQSLTEGILVGSVDGTPQMISVTILGTNDVAVIGGTHTGDVIEDSADASGHLTASGQLTVTDPDAGQEHFIAMQGIPGDHGYGSFNIDAQGHWAYSADNSQPSIQTLKGGQTVTDSVTFMSADGTPQTITVTVTGSNDGAVISGADHGVIREDINADSSDHIVTTGLLAVTDVDSGEARFNMQLGVHGTGGYGNFIVTPNGHWTYTISNTDARIQSLGQGQHLTDTLEATSIDGTRHTISVTIEGSNDKPTITAQTQSIAEDGGPLTGRMVAQDVDTGDTQTFSTTATIPGFTLRPDGSYSFDPSHADYQHLAAGEAHPITIPITVTDAAGATATENLVINLTGTNDGAVIAGVDRGTVTEDTSVAATPGWHDAIHTSGTLTVSDADTGEAHFTPQTDVAGDHGYGHFTIMSNGTWLYHADNDDPRIQALGAGSPALTDSFVVTSADGTQHTITVSIQGSNDAPTISAATQSATEDSVVHGQMHATDADAGDHLSFSIATPVDGFTLNADGSYSFDATGAAYQSLAQGEHRDITIPITVTDAAHATSTQNLVITLTGTDDAPVIGATSTAAASASSGPAMEITTGDALLQMVEAMAASSINLLQYQVGGAVLGYAADYLQALHSDKLDAMDDMFVSAAPDQMQKALSAYLVTDYGIVLKGPAGTPDQVIRGEENDFARSGGMTMGDLINWQNKGAGYSVQFLRPVGGESHFFLSENGRYNTGVYEAGREYLPSDQKAEFSINPQHHFSFVAQTPAGPAPEVTTGETQEDVHTSVTGTLHAHDVDHGDTLSFSVKGNVHGSYGDFHVDAATGTWTYTLHAGAQALKTGDTQHETFTLVVTDAHGQSVEQVMTMTVKGSDDGSVIAGDLTGAVTEDTTLTASGKLSISDADAADHPGFVVHDASNPIHGTYGSLTLDAQGNWHYTLDNSLDAVQKLGVGAPALSDLISVQASDGSVQLIHISVAGTNDAPTVSASTVDLAATTEGTPHTYVEAQLLALVGAKDIDDMLTITGIAVDPQYGSFARQTGGGGLARWVFTPAAGVHHDDIPLTLTISDGHVTTTAHAQLDITPSLMTGALTGSAVEDTATTITGDLISPTAGTALHLGDQTMAGTYGSLDLRDGGHWVYTLHNAAAGVQGLKAGETHTEHFSVQGPGGVAQDIAITVTGTHDAPVISVPTAAQQTIGAVTVVHELTAATDLSSFTTAQAGVAVGHKIVGLYMPGSSVNELAGIAPDQRPSTHSAYSNVDAAGYQFLTGNAWFENHLTGGAERFKPVPPQIRNAWDGGLVVFDDGSVGRLVKVCDDPRPGEHDYVYFNLIPGANAQHGLTQLTGSGTAGSQVEVFEGTTSLGHATVGADGHWAYTVPHALNDGDHVLHTVSGGVQSALMHAQVSSGVATLSVETPSIGSVAEDAAQNSISGQLSVTDADMGDNPVFTVQAATAGHYGSFQIDAQGHWHYTLDNSLDATQALAAGSHQTETFHVEVTTASGEHVSRDVTVTVTGADDHAVIAGADSGAINSGATLTAQGTLTATDADSTAPAFVAQSAVAGTYGSFTVDAAGVWHYTLDPTLPATQALAGGTHQTDTFTVTTADGASHAVSVTVTGGNHGPTVAATDVAHAADLGTTLEDTPKTFTEADLLRLVGATDADHDTLHVSSVTVDATAGAFAKQSDGSWVFTPAPNFQGSHLPVSLVVSDGHLDTTAHALMDVTPVADKPVLGVSLGAGISLLSASLATEVAITVGKNYPGDVSSDFPGVFGPPALMGTLSDLAHVIGIMVGGTMLQLGGVIDSSFGSGRYIVDGDSNNQFIDYNGDGSIKLILDDTAPTVMKFAVHYLEEGNGVSYVNDVIAWPEFTSDRSAGSSGGGGGGAAAGADHFQANVFEDQDVPLVVTLSDPDSSEHLAVTIAGMPAGAALSAGTHNTDGTWSLTPAQLSGLHMTPPQDFKGDMHLTVTATSTDHTDTAHTTFNLDLSFKPVAEAPHLQATDPHVVDEAVGTPIALDVQLGVHHDTSEQVSLQVAGIPNGATLSAGSKNADGTWTLQPADLHGLTVTPAAHWSGTMTLHVIATSTEQTGESASATASLSVHVNPVIDMHLSGHDLTLTQGNAFSLSQLMQITQPDSGESATFTFRVPSSWTLSGGTHVVEGVTGDATIKEYHVPLADLAAAQFHPPADYHGTQQITLHAVVTENGVSQPVNLPVSLTVQVPLADVAAVSVATTFTGATDLGGLHESIAGVAGGLKIVGFYLPGSDVNQLAGMDANHLPQVDDGYIPDSPSGWQYIRGAHWLSQNMPAHAADFPNNGANPWANGLVVFEDGTVGRLQKLSDGMSYQYGRIYFTTIDGINAHQEMTHLQGAAAPNSQLEVFDSQTSLGLVTVGADGHWSLVTPHAMVDGNHPIHIVSAGVTFPEQVIHVQAGAASVVAPVTPLTLDAHLPVPAPAPSADAADAAVTADFSAQTDTHANAGEAFHVDVQPVLTAAGGGDHLDVRLSLLPAGSVVSDGVHSETVSATNPGVNVSGWHFDALVVTPPAGHTESYVFDIKARPTDDATANWSMHEVQVDLHHGAGLPNAVVSGDDRASTDEHDSVSGVLTVSDADTGQAHFHAAAMQGDYGSLNVDDAGHWTYATNEHADALASGEHVADHFGVTTADGTVHQVVIGITGTDDLPVDAHAAAAPVDAYMQLVASAPHDVAVDAAAHTDAALDVYLSAAGVAADGLQHDAGLAMPPTELLLDMHSADAATGSPHTADATPVDDHALALDTTHLHDLTPLDDPQHQVI